MKNRVFTGLILHVEVSHQGSRNDWPSYTGFINHRYSRIFCKQMLVGIDIYIYLPSHPPLRQNILMVRPSHILHPSGPQPMLISLGLLINSPFFLPLQLPLSTSGLVLTPFALSLGHPNPIYKIYNPEIKSYPVVNCHITMENHGKSPYYSWENSHKLTIPMAIFNSYFDKLPQGISHEYPIKSL